MRRRVTLYIGGKMVDLDSESFILFNYTRDEASNPTIVRNSFSQSITIPGTRNNNDIFGRLFQVDSISFNPLKKVDFILFNELNEVLERGYARLDTIKREGAKVSYNISLFGGLGGFFYTLTYDAEGNKRTLADMYFLDPQDERGIINPKTYSFPINKGKVATAWQSLSGSTPEFINFAPCNNGFASCKFSSNKAIYKEQTGSSWRFPNLYSSQYDDTDRLTYKSKNNDGVILLEFGEKHTEWETEDLRSYLQRPVIRFRKFIEALERSENSGDYTFVIDTSSSFFQSTNPSWDNLWMTLAMFDRDKIDPATAKLSDLFNGTASPAEYLISFAKVFGLVFVVDNASNTITLTDRNAYYRNEVIDLSDKVSPDRDITPCVMTSKIYDFAYPSVIGEYAKQYEDKYSRKYGLQRVNTGYEFNTTHEDTLKDIVFKGCADVLESSINMAYYGGDVEGEYGQYINNELKFAFTDSVKWKLYAKRDNKDIEKEYSPLQTYTSRMGYSDNNKDFFARPQMHGEDNKAEDGSNILLFFEGMIDTPSEVVSGFELASAKFHLSDDTTEMLALNGGEPCYDVSYSGSNIQGVGAIPSFRRWHLVDGVVSQSLDPGTPLEVALDETPNADENIYNDSWREYIADKFSKDTRIVNLKVDFSGMMVSAGLLRKFYWFDNALWVLNKITNYSLTTNDPVECEFIQVADKNNYLNGQSY